MSLLKFTATTTPTPLNSACNLIYGDKEGYALLATCTGTPPVTADVFEHGCLMYQLDSGTGVAAVYQNTGSTAVPSWTLMDTASTSLQLPEAATDSTTTTGTSLALTQNTVTTGTGFSQSLTGLTTGIGHSIVTSALTTGQALSITASTAGVANVQPVILTTTLTGAGATGGRFKSVLNANAALGGWSNAIKGEVVYNASGSTSGLGSAIVSEMTLSAGTSAGTYTLFEGELNLGAGASTGTETSLMYLSVNQTGGNTAFDDNGFIMSIQGLTANAADAFRTGLTGATVVGNMTAAIRIKIGSTTYFIPLATATT